MEKNAVISYLTTQLTTKSQNTVNQNSYNIDIKKEPQISNSNKVNGVTMEICNKKNKECSYDWRFYVT